MNRQDRQERRDGFAIETTKPFSYWLTTLCGKFILFANIVGEGFAGAGLPYPESPVIAGVTFASSTTILRKALGSDNWPMTWCDDDTLFTAYGDGWGFEPRIATKLSQGFARIVGLPPDFKGINVRSPSGERSGDGRAGPKASGMLLVDGLLYMWVRNTSNSTIAWSSDRGATWQWGFRFTESFGCPAFLNFGKNYAGARDEFVYTYSADGPSAYEAYDGIVLARVAKSKITERDAYEFFKGMDNTGRPLWTTDLKSRKPVFVYAGHCERIEVVYDRGIKRYLMALGFNHESGWGLFDAPEPWGPWTTAFYTERWDIPGTHGYRLPTKWISPDGKTLYLVFSGTSAGGYDAFCVRRMTLTPSP
jgi:hypothetical protein